MLRLKASRARNTGRFFLLHSSQRRSAGNRQSLKPTLRESIGAPNTTAGVSLRRTQSSGTKNAHGQELRPTQTFKVSCLPQVHYGRLAPKIRLTNICLTSSTDRESGANCSLSLSRAQTFRACGPSQNPMVMAGELAARRFGQVLPKFLSGESCSPELTRALVGRVEFHSC